MEAKEFFAKCSAIALQKVESFDTDDIFYDEGFIGREEQKPPVPECAVSWPADIHITENEIDGNLVVGYFRKNGYFVDSKARLKQMILRKFGIEFADDVNIEALKLETVELLSPSPIVITHEILEKVLRVPKQMMFSVLSVFSPMYADALISYAISDHADARLVQKYRCAGKEVLEAFLQISRDADFSQYAFDRVDYKNKDAKAIIEEYNKRPGMPAWFRERFGDVIADSPYFYALSEDMKKYLPGCCIPDSEQVAVLRYTMGLPEREYKMYLLASVYGMQIPESVELFTQYCMQLFLTKKGISFDVHKFIAGDIIVALANGHIKYLDADYLPFASETFEPFYSSEYKVRALDDYRGILVYHNSVNPDGLCKMGTQAASSISMWADSTEVIDVDHILHYNFYTAVGSRPQHSALVYEQKKYTSYIFVDKLFGYVGPFPELKCAFASMDTNVVLRSIGVSVFEQGKAHFIWKFLAGAFRQTLINFKYEKNVKLPEDVSQLTVEVAGRVRSIPLEEVMMGFDGICRLREGGIMHIVGDKIALKFW